MKRIVTIVSIGLIATLARFAAAVELSIATNEYPPYVSEQIENSFLGEVFQEVGKEMGVTFVFKYMPWNRCLYSVDQMDVWGAIPYVRTPARAERYLFSEKLYGRQSKFFYYSPSGEERDIAFDDLASLKKYRIGGVLGFWYEQMFADAGIKLDMANTEEQNFKKLHLGRFDLTPADENVGWYIIKHQIPADAHGRFFTVGKPFDVSDIYLLVSKNYPDSPHLLAEFNKALNTVRKNGIYQKLQNKHGLSLR